MLTFTREEYEERLHRARRLMAEERIDALLVSAPANLVYLSGYRTQLFDSNFRPFLAIIPLESEPVLLLPDLELGVGQETSPFTDVRAWGWTKGCIAPDALSGIRDIVVERKLDQGHIAIEQGDNMRIGMGLDQFAQLKEMLPEVDWPNSAPLLWRLRRVKSPAEVAYVRESQRITDVAYHAVLEAAHEGVNELELLSVLGTRMMEEGADTPGFQIITSGANRYKMANPYPVDRKLEKGDMVILDIGSIYRGYYSDITRGFFVGEPTSRQREFYEASVAITADAVAAVKPGATCSSVDTVAEQSTRDRGYWDYVLHRTGHSLGLEVHEMPSIAPGDETVLEPGMIVTIEPGIYDFSIGAFRMEDLILVTEDGYEYLSHAERQLVCK
jgi:Xaa-Pro aminopeptidase